MHPLPIALTLRDALKEDAPVLHEKMTILFKGGGSGGKQDTGVKGNIAGHVQFKLGEREKGFAEADVVVEQEFDTETVHQGYIEPHACTVNWNPRRPGNGLDLHPEFLWNPLRRSRHSGSTGIKAVKVVPTEIGGGFGAKFTCYLEATAAVLSRKSNRPVKMVMDRREVFEGTGPAAATNMRCKIGATKAGKITAAELYMAYEAGAYPGSPVEAGAMAATAITTSRTS